MKWLDMHPGGFKRALFRTYGWIALVAFGVTLIVVALRPSFEWQWLGTVLTACATFVFTVQKQKLDEMTLFLELFEKFNRRYDKLNEHLNKMFENEPIDRRKLNDYFNLCGEEYLLFREGHVHPEVWRAWRNGMGYAFLHKEIHDIWQAELANNSYYGLSADDLARASRDVADGMSKPLPKGFEIPETSERA